MATDANSQISTNYSVGLHNASSYQSSGTPWITGSALKAEILSGSVRTYRFPRVAKSITVQSVPNSTFIPGAARPLNTDSLVIFFGEPKTIAGTDRAGDNTFSTNPNSPQFIAPATAPPLQYSQAHAFTVSYMSGANSSGGSFTTTIRTDHINVACIGTAASAATSSFQIFAELTNIPAARMPADYISGSGVNTV